MELVFRCFTVVLEAPEMATVKGRKLLRRLLQSIRPQFSDSQSNNEDSSPSLLVEGGDGSSHIHPVEDAFHHFLQFTRMDLATSWSAFSSLVELLHAFCAAVDPALHKVSLSLPPLSLFRCLSVCPQLTQDRAQGGPAEAGQRAQQRVLPPAADG